MKMADVLDLDAVRAFVHVADLCSFTRAADALGTTQSAVSLKVKRLESHLGKALFERTPRSVRLSAAGHAFLTSARDLLDAHQRALASLAAERRTLKIGISEHVVGSQLVRIVENLHRHDSRLILEVHLGSSFPLLAQYDERRLDAVIVRYEADEAPAWSARTDAEPLFVEPLVWLAAAGWRPEPGEPLPLAMIAPPCGVRGVAIRALERANIAWQETFVGGGIAAVGAALAAGLAVSALAKRVAPAGLVEVNGKNGLPALPTLPKSQIVMHSRMRDPRAAAALRILAASIERG
jgi:DNA-binding transcriptional LysR family regulator